MPARAQKKSSKKKRVARSAGKKAGAPAAGKAPAARKAPAVRKAPATKSDEILPPTPGEGRLGILAGDGNLPWLGVKGALAAGEDVRVFHIYEDAPPPEYHDISTRVYLLKLFSSVISSMRKQGITRLQMLGKSHRDMLYKSSIFDFDWRLIFLLARSASQTDYSIFELVLREFEKKGIRIIPQDTYLQQLYLKPGRYGKKCSTRELEDISFGMIYAREVNRLDIGQTVVVGKKSVMAVECAEGTDKCIRRGGELFNGKGAVVCKVAKVKHDRRFDIPVTGLSTLESMRDAGCRILAVEASATMVVEPGEFLQKAKEYNITIVALDPERSDPGTLKKLNASAATL